MVYSGASFRRFFPNCICPRNLPKVTTWTFRYHLSNLTIVQLSAPDPSMIVDVIFLYFPTVRSSDTYSIPPGSFVLSNVQVHSPETIIHVDDFSLYTSAVGLFYVLVFWLYLKKGNKPCLACKPSLKLGLVNKGRFLTLEKYSKLLIFGYK